MVGNDRDMGEVVKTMEVAAAAAVAAISHPEISSMNGGWVGQNARTQMIPIAVAHRSVCGPRMPPSRWIPIKATSAIKTNGSTTMAATHIAA